jgi:hypothetical protein
LFHNQQKSPGTSPTESPTELASGGLPQAGRSDITLKNIIFIIVFNN